MLNLRFDKKKPGINYRHNDTIEDNGGGMAMMMMIKIMITIGIMTE